MNSFNRFNNDENDRYANFSSSNSRFEPEQSRFKSFNKNDESPFQNWNKKERIKKAKSERVIVKPHCELFLTSLPRDMRTVGTLAGEYIFKFILFITNYLLLRIHCNPSLTELILKIFSFELAYAIKLTHQLT